MDTILLMLFVVCMVLRGIIFQNRGEMWIKTLIPCYNKYILGKLSDSKKLGLMVAIANALFYIVTFIKVVLESYIVDAINMYATEITESLSDIVPQNIITANNICEYVVYVSAGIYFILWVTLMRKFSELQQTSTWWMILWGLCPIVPYIYYTFIYQSYYIPKEGLVYREVMRKKSERKKK